MTTSKSQPCPTCGGSGENTHVKWPSGEIPGLPGACPACHGTGKAPSASKCPLCGSTEPIHTHAGQMPEDWGRLGQLVMDLKRIKPGDEEVNHALADQLLLDYINDPKVTEAYEAIDKWYA